MGQTWKTESPPEGAAITGTEYSHQAIEWAEGLHQAQGRMVDALVSSGRLLATARRSLPPQDYRQWLLDSFGWSVEAAEALIRASEFAVERGRDTLDQWHAGALLCLSDPAVRRAARIAVVEARRGGRITHRRALELISEHSPEAAA